MSRTAAPGGGEEATQPPGATVEPSQPSAAVPLHRNAGYRLLWIGQVLSDTGTNAALIAYPLLILALTHSAVIAGVVGTVRLVVELLLGLPGGAISDRMDRRLTMIACDSTRAAVLALLAVLVLAHAVSWPIVLVVAAIDGAGSVLFSPAATAALPAIVADSQLEQAWAATEARTYAAGLVGPAIGGALFGLGSAIPFVGDAVSYLVSVGTVSRIRGQFRPQRASERTSLLREAADGIRLAWKHPLLRAVMVQAPLINFAFSGVIFAITLALRRHGTAPGVIGLAQAGISVGGLIGALLAPRLQSKLRISQLAVALTVSSTALFIVAAAILPSTLVALPIAVTLLLAPAANAALFAAMLRATPAEMRGRVTSTVLLAATALAALSPLTAGLLVEQLSGRWALLAFAAVMAIAAVLCVALPGLRAAEAVDAAEPAPLADSGATSS